MEEPNKIINQDVSQRDIEFDRSKIYENLSYAPEPEGYVGKLPWKVQNQIAATNGVHYIDLIGKLNDYPQYELPVDKVTGEKLMLDIGSGWGRWLIAGARKGYIPIGMDLRLEFCEMEQNILRHFKYKGYSVVGDLENPPFKNDVFDLVWSFSVLQHTHIMRFTNCLQAVDHLLQKDGFIKTELPNKKGIYNSMRPDKINNPRQQDYNDWSVRYYTLNEYKNIFEAYLRDVSFSVHSMLGIGVLKEDLKYVSFKNKIMCAGSLALTGLSKVITPLQRVADSIYAEAKKKSLPIPNPGLSEFLKFHQQKEFDNLHVVPLLKCPKYGTSLSLSADRKKLISQTAGISYPIINNIPILIGSEATPI